MTDFPGPSTYTPLFRRLFTDERQEELDEVANLYARVASYEQAFSHTKESVAVRVMEEFFRGYPDAVLRPTALALYDLLSLEPAFAPLPAPDFSRMTMRETVEYRNLLNAKERFFVNQTADLELLHEGELMRWMPPSPGIV